MPLHLPTFFTRLGSAVVFSVVMLAGLLWNEWSFLALICLILALCLWEYYRLMALINQAPERRSLKLLTIATGLVFAVFTSLLYQGRGNGLEMPFLFCLVCLPILLLMAGPLAKNGTLRHGLEAMGGLIYIVVPCVLLIIMREISWHLPLVLILCIWTNDTMAYLVGSFLGRTPFSPISPKKTWEGTVGGAMLTVAGALLAAYFIPNQNMLMYGGIAACAAVAGTAGDLLESKLKRMAGVKDSGKLMPGHGGALDRFDSLLVATPFAFALIVLLLGAF